MLSPFGMQIFYSACGVTVAYLLFRIAASKTGCVNSLVKRLVRGRSTASCDRPNQGVRDTAARAGSNAALATEAFSDRLFKSDGHRRQTRCCRVVG